MARKRVKDSSLRTFNLEEFDPAFIEDDATVALCGPRGSGKSSMTFKILMEKRNVFDIVVVFCTSQDTVDEFRRFLPECLCFLSFTADDLKRIISFQKTLHRAYRDRDKLLSIAVIMDDCSYDKASLNNEHIRYFFMNGRHERFFFLVSSQYGLDVPKACRPNIDIAIIFPFSDPSVRETLRQSTLPCFRNDAEMEHVFSTSIHAHEALVYCAKRARDKQSCLFYWGTDAHIPNFVLCAPAIWRWYYRHMKRVDREKLRSEALRAAQHAAGVPELSTLPGAGAGASASASTGPTAAPAGAPGAGMAAGAPAGMAAVRAGTGSAAPPGVALATTTDAAGAEDDTLQAAAAQERSKELGIVINRAPKRKRGRALTSTTHVARPALPPLSSLPVPTPVGASQRARTDVAASQHPHQPLPLAPLPALPARR